MQLRELCMQDCVWVYNYFPMNYFKKVIAWWIFQESNYTLTTWCAHCTLDYVWVYNISNPKQPRCKKSVRPSKRLWWKKMWNPRWLPRNGCDGRLMVKILITTIQVNFVPIDQAAPKFTWIVVIKIFTINLPSQPFLGRHLGFHIFFSP